MTFVVNTSHLHMIIGSLSISTIIIRPRGYKTFFMLNLTEHEIYPADKYFNIYQQDNTTSEGLKARKLFIHLYLSFYEQLKFRALLS